MNETGVAQAAAPKCFLLPKQLPSKGHIVRTQTTLKPAIACELSRHFASCSVPKSACICPRNASIYFGNGQLRREVESCLCKCSIYTQ